MTDPRKKGRQGHHYIDKLKREAVQLLTSTPATTAGVSECPTRRQRRYKLLKTPSTSSELPLSNWISRFHCRLQRTWWYRGNRRSKHLLHS